MEKPSSSGKERTLLSRYFLTLLILWTVLVGLVLAWSLLRQKHETSEVACIQARHSIEKDLVYRRWATGHGGVYVPRSDKTPSNTYLSHIEERDITTPSGRALTLVNPAYMMRQVHELGLEQYGEHGHITSSKPLRPLNAADAWETKALRAFEQGVKEVSSIEKLDDQNYLRLMHPMMTEQGCLKCHVEQGYRVGDLRGGISVAVPMAPIQAIARGHALTLTGGHFVLWLLGASGIGLGGQRLKQRLQERHSAEEQIEGLAKFPSENPNPVLRMAKTGVLLYANDASGPLLTEWNCPVNHIVPDNCQKIISEAFASGKAQRVEMGHGDKILEFMVVPVLDAGYANFYGRDISGRKRAAIALQEAHNTLEGRVLERTTELSEATEQLTAAIKDRVQKEQELQAAELRYRTVADFTYDWEYWENPDGSLCYVSPACERITGYDASQFMTHPQLLQDIILREDKEVWDKHRHHVQNKMEAGEVQFRVLRQDGQIRWIEHACQPVLDNQGDFLGFRASNRDVTDRKNAEQEAHRLREEYVHIARIAAMGELTAALAHELKQPLASIRSNAQAAQRFLAHEKPDLDGFREILVDIIKDNRRADDIISKLRVLMQKGDPQVTALNINDVIREASPLIDSYKAMENISLEFDLDGGIPPAAGDRVQLQQVLLNLVLNASEALMNVEPESRKIVVRTMQQNPQAVTVAVQDNGTGIDEQLAGHLFAPFYTSKATGLGVGLSVSRSIIESLGGKLWAENNPVRGATFYFTVPFLKENPV
jgi:two-component system cell cycle sensor histidine kinase/response regulator CckA